MQNQVVNQAGGLRRCNSWLSSTIGRRQIIGVTGLGLSGFVLLHMLGNMLILVSPRVYNEYSHKLVSNPLLIVAEVGLVVMFLGHILLALGLAVSNWKARDTRYAMSASGEKRTTLIQKSLWAQGLLILVFVILHLITFKYGTVYTVTYDGVEMRDLHRLVLEVFAQPGYSVWYIAAVFVLGLHLSHGFGSSFQTLGIHHPRYQTGIRCLSILYAVIVTVGFISQPVFVLLNH
jgi:succinate dehydrogenase / fumarate reductase cytochrome b subunit